MGIREENKVSIFYTLPGIRLTILCLSVFGCELVVAQDTHPDSPKTTVYKVINPDGSVSFSDKALDNAIRMEVTPVTTVPAYKVVGKTNQTKESDKVNETYYRSLEILSPVNGSTFHSGNGNINISTKIEPPLRSGDLVRFSLDGKVIKSLNATSLQLSNIDRGTHTINVELITPSNETMLSTTSQFTVHRPIAKRR